MSDFSKIEMGSYKDTETKNNKHDVICICGESGAGKTTLANIIKNSYPETIILDGDAVRKYINKDLTYTDSDRKKNNEIIADIAELLYNQGHKVIISTVKANIAHDVLKSKNIKSRLITCS